MGKENRYTITETQIRYILNHVLSNFWILFPYNARHKAQEKFIKYLRDNFNDGGG